MVEVDVVVVVLFRVVVVARLTVVVVVGLVGRDRGRVGETTSLTVACQATRVPGAGDWRSTTRHVPLELPGPRVEKYSCACLMTAKVRARDSPIRRGTRRGPWGVARDTVSVAWACQATRVPGRGDWATTVVHSPVDDPGPRVEKYSRADLIAA